mgnify:CR=1 FL=1
MRLRAEVWVKAYLRICMNAGANAVVARHGDDDAGAVFIKVLRRDGAAALYGPAPSGIATQDIERAWSSHLTGDDVTEAAVDSYLARQIDFDPDIWIVEVEDRDGRHFLDDWLVWRT